MRQLFTVTSTVTQWTQQWPIRTQCTIAWLPVINFASFRWCDFYWDKRWQNNKRVYKEFFVNVVNVYDIYACSNNVITSVSDSSSSLHLQSPWRSLSAATIIVNISHSPHSGKRPLIDADVRLFVCMSPGEIARAGVVIVRRCNSSCIRHRAPLLGHDTTVAWDTITTIIITQLTVTHLLFETV